MGTKLDQTLAILNGAVGDHLARTDNALATELAFVDAKSALASATPRAVVLVHGLMCTETIWKLDDGEDYGSLLARDRGYTPLRVRYNSGRAISDSGAALARVLDELARSYPIPLEEILLVGFSMGGLVARAACATAIAQRHAWLSLVKRAIYIGTPHAGSPYERAGRVISRVLRAVPDPYTRLAAQICDLRSEGIQDLGDGLHPVPLLPGIRHYLVAGTLASDPHLALWFGDAMVPVRSATAHAIATTESLALPPDHVKIFGGLSHMKLPRDRGVYDQILAWCSP